jgi:hypothetical protein
MSLPSPCRVRWNKQDGTLHNMFYVGCLEDQQRTGIMMSRGECKNITYLQQLLSKMRSCIPLFTEHLHQAGQSMRGFKMIFICMQHGGQTAISNACSQLQQMPDPISMMLLLQPQLHQQLHQTRNLHLLTRCCADACRDT